MRPLISIIIPSYNSSTTLKKCLDSIFQSRYKNFEVIVVDDNSKDYSYRIAQEYPCKLIHLPQRSGPAKARNTGVRIAEGQILVFLDSDCVVDRDWLKNTIRNFKIYNVGATASQYRSSLNKNFISLFAFYELLYRERKFDRFVNTAPSCNFACKKGIFEEIGGFSEGFKHASEDLDFSYRLGKITRILWDPSISVAHYFRDKIGGYIKQQFNSSRDNVYLFIKHPELLLIDTHEDKTNYLEIISTVIFFIFIPLYILKLVSLIILLIPLLLILMLNINFISFVSKKENIWYSIKSIFLIYLRNFIWLLGILAGLFREIVKIAGVKNVRIC